MVILGSEANAQLDPQRLVILWLVLRYLLWFMAGRVVDSYNPLQSKLLFRLSIRLQRIVISVLNGVKLSLGLSANELCDGTTTTTSSQSHQYC